jgi:hypothetical protein
MSSWRSYWGVHYPPSREHEPASFRKFVPWLCPYGFSERRTGNLAILPVLRKFGFVSQNIRCGRFPGPDSGAARQDDAFGAATVYGAGGWAERLGGGPSMVSISGR